MFVSTFELLLNASQLPREAGGVPASALEALQPISRSVLQGYFLTIANLENREVMLQFLFNVVSTEGEDKFDSATVTTFFDADGVNRKLGFTSDTRSLMLSLKPKDTGLLLVQPDPLLLTKPLKDSEIEIRGYVEIKSLQASGEESEMTRVLLTPEHRGTFYNLDIPKKPDPLDDTRMIIDREANLTLLKDQKLDQIAYSLPTGGEGSLFNLN